MSESVLEIPKGTNNNWTSLIRIYKNNNIVEKAIDYDGYSQELFEREVYWLTKLSYSGIVPKVFNTNPETRTITMSWCSEILSEDNKPPDTYQQLYNIHMILLENHCLYNDWKWSNFLVKEGKITIIDFGWCPLITEDYSCNGLVTTNLTAKPAGNFFKNIFAKEEPARKAKLLDLNHDWLQARPHLITVDSGLIASGYQQYKISQSNIVPVSDNTRLKFDLVKNTVKDDVTGRTVADLGCSNMFFGFLSNYLGATKVTGVDLDLEYIDQNNKIINHFDMQNISCQKINVVDFKEVNETVFAFAIIHWIYSCSGFLGSLEKVVDHLRSITSHVLYVEWVDPTDDCITYFNHLDYNKELVTPDYTREHFLQYLQKVFSHVTLMGLSKQTREIYRCNVE